MDISVVEPFGRYRLVGVLANGGMARLALGVMTGADDFSRVVAVKQVLPHLAQSREFLQMFLNEGRLAARLDHPNIVRIYELGQIDDQYFISMEYLAGEDLSRIIRQSRERRLWIPVPAAVVVIQHITEALQCAHELRDEHSELIGLVHRDISPSNIITTYHGGAKLADFGIAKATAVAHEVGTRTGVFKGKFAYAAPEQVGGGSVDARSDVFAAGIVLWELICLRRLFKREHEVATIRAVENAEVPPMRSLRPEVPAQLEEVVLTALAKDPAKRFQNANAMSEALDDVLRTIRARTSPKLVRTWLAELFGEDRAKLKMAIAQGRGLENLDPESQRVVLSAAQADLLDLKPMPPRDRAERGDSAADRAEGSPVQPKRITRDRASASGSGSPSSGSHRRPPPLPTDESPSSPSGTPSTSTSEPRAAWSTDITPNPTWTSAPFQEAISWTATNPQQHSVSETAARIAIPRHAWTTGRRLWSTLGAVALLISSVGVAWSMWSGGHDKASAGELRLSTDPPVASILVNGEATGLMTPASLQHLPTGRLLLVRLEKSSYAPEEFSITLRPGERLDRVVPLRQLALVRFELPSETVVQIGGKRLSNGETTELIPGEHKALVLRGNTEVGVRSLSVRPGPQDIKLKD